MKTLLLSILLLLAAVVLLGVKVFFVKGGSFPKAHAHDIMNKRAKNNSHTHPYTNQGND
ncbi:MAG: hypothetical protein K2M06_03080 [Muribaculaceae bacterium]|nr:hypothetical protein [Muribaculaceae bacterium]